jgi:glycosyltransferase involved in cell wall biosynthesis
MAQRKIAFVTPLYFSDESCIGGGERYPSNLARGVVAASGGVYSVEILSFGARPQTLPIAPGITLRVLEAVGRPANPVDALSWDLPAALADADLVHIHQMYTRSCEVALLVAKQQRKPVCMTDHGGNSSSLGQKVGFLELADLIISNSEFGAAMHQTGTRKVVVLGGVDARFFCPPDDQATRGGVLYVGRLMPHKGIDRLIRAIRPDIPLTVCGRPYHADYFALLQGLAQGKTVRFLTASGDEEIRELYRHSWVNVLPSTYKDCYGHVHLAPELMGFTLLEAMACGTPAICSRVGGMPEYVRHGETGFVFDTEEELAGYLKLLSADRDLVEAMGHSARKLAVERYDLTVAGRRLVELYRELLLPAREVAA